MLVYGWVIVTIAGDVEGDFDVDIFDLATIAAYYGTEMGDPRYKPNVDIDGNGIINLQDLVSAAANYGQQIRFPG